MDLSPTSSAPVGPPGPLFGSHCIQQGSPQFILAAVIRAHLWWPELRSRFRDKAKDAQSRSELVCQEST